MKNLINIVVGLLLFTRLSAQPVYSIFINEFLASNATINADLVDFDDFSDWIELYNNEDFDVNLGGYFLTDDKNNLSRWQFPQDVTIKAKGFLLVWADRYDSGPGNYPQRPWPNNCDPLTPLYFEPDYYHLNFNLSRAGEFIGLCEPDGSVVDSVSFDLQYRDVSMGRKPDGSTDWYYFGEPTPEYSNSTQAVIIPEYTGKPMVIPESGFYEGSAIVSLNTSSPQATMNYTLDGSKPTSKSIEYENPITLTKTTVFRTRQFEDSKLPGSIPNRTYFIDENTSLPVISITTPPDLLFDEKYGIYDNRLRIREIPVGFEFFPNQDSPALSLNAGLRLSGQGSMCYAQISFTIEAEDRFGPDDFDYRFFSERESKNFKSIYLRNAGVPDHQSTFMRDALMHSLVLNKMDLDCQAYLPTVVFINGEYWGIYNLRDKINKEYIGFLHNINPDEIDLLEYSTGRIPEEMNGSRDNYIAFYNYIDTTDLSVEENYRFLESWMDVDEYINYQICEIFYDNVLWPDQNMRMWRERKKGAKWRWILFDTDIGFGMPSTYSHGASNNTLAWATSTYPGTSNPPTWSTRIFTQLLKNEEFKTKFVQRFAGYMNTLFHPDTVIAVIDQIAGRLSAEMPRHIDRWKNYNDFGPPIPNYTTWLNNVDALRTYARHRPAYQRQHIMDYFGLGGTAVVMLSFEDENMGYIKINETETRISNSSGIYFKDLPLSFEAIPKVGFRFSGWSGAEDDTLNKISITPATDTVHLTAGFEKLDISIIPGSITNDTTLDKQHSPWYASGDIVVDSNTTLTIESGVELMMPEKACIIIYGKLLVEGTEEEPVLITPNEYTQDWGALCFINSTDSSVVKYLTIIGATRGHDFTRDRAAVSGYHADFSLEHLSITEGEAPVFIQYGNVNIKACTLYADVAGDLINVKYAESIIIEDCDLLGSDNFDSDAIDYDHLSGGIIRGNRIRNFYGFNSDAIDLGENSQDILIENNIIYNINDKGVSIGSGSSAIVKRNIIANCGMGIGVKDYDSYAYAEHNTFYGNGSGIASFVKNIGEGGGNTDAVNCIFTNSKSSSVFKDKLSYANISYSLSNTDVIEGLHNMEGDPLFLNNFRLSESSLAIDAGNPVLPSDPDGSVADLGALPFDADDQDNLIINEIHYNPPEGDNYQFIELFNAGAGPINLNSCQLSGNVNFTFPGTEIEPGKYILIGKDSSIYEGNGYDVLQWNKGNLNHFPGRIDLTDTDGKLIDFVDYDSRYLWPREPDGQGPSLELHTTNLENMVSTSWRSSYEAGGTPGASNSSIKIEGIYINEYLASNHETNADEYGEYDDWIEFYNSTDEPINMGGLYITDSYGNPLKHQIPIHAAELTTIPARGFLLFWADRQPEQGVLHLSFVLDRLGEQIGLTQLYEDDARFIDSLSYTVQQTDISVGRYTDGSENWIEFTTPTPLASNLVNDLFENEIIPESITQLTNYPNPFRGKTVISYQLPVIGEIKLTIYDFTGRRINTLINETQPAGNHKVEWNAAGFKPGIYFCELRTEASRIIRKMILLE